jgi:hypothetical protein
MMPKHHPENIKMVFSELRAEDAEGHGTVSNG